MRLNVAERVRQAEQDGQTEPDNRASQTEQNRLTDHTYFDIVASMKDAGISEEANSKDTPLVEKVSHRVCILQTENSSTHKDMPPLCPDSPSNDPTITLRHNKVVSS